MKKIISIYVLAISICLNLQAQYYEISLEEKMNNAELVIEGEVVESESFRPDDRNIYTAHKIKIYKSFKDEPKAEHISIITRGGTLDGLVQTWTHMLSLSKGQSGIFFLEKTISPPNNMEKVTDEYYKVFSGVQGFLEYNEKATGLIASELFNTYENVHKDLFETFTSEYQKTYKTYTPSKWNYTQKNNVVESYTSSAVQDGRCLDFLFEVISPDLSNPLLVTTIVSVKASENTHITKPVIRANYNALSLGSNLASSGGITLEDIGVSADVNYQSVIEDIAPDKVEIKISASSLEQPDLVEITTSYTVLVKINILLPGPLDPEIFLDQASMTSLSKYFDFTDGIEKQFDCLRIEGDFGAYLCPEPSIAGLVFNTVGSITAPMDPVDLVAGHDQFLMIFGQCFGDVQGNSYVEFENASRGPDQDEWIRPLPEDYNVPHFDGTNPWTDQIIRVRIPSKGLIHSSRYAGSGKVRINVNGEYSTWIIPADEIEIDIDYAVENTINSSSEATFPDHVQLVTLNNLNNFGGYDLWYGEGMDENLEAQTAFESALFKWVCEVKVNFEVKDLVDPVPMTPGNGEIKFGDLPIGQETTLAETSNQPQSCDINGVSQVSRMLYFTMVFNDEVNWYYDEDTDIVLTGSSLIDFQSTALHELGHSIGLNHVNNSEDLMFWTDASPPTDFNRDITYDAKLGGEFLVFESGLSIQPASCATLNPSFTAMEPLFLGEAECLFLNSVDELNNASSFISIYPNPSSDLFYVNDKKDRPKLNYEINNILGDLLLKGSSFQNQGIDIRNFSKGIYFLNISDEDQFIGTYKIIKD